MDGKMEIEQYISRIQELEKELAVAEKGWRDASQANALLSSQIQKLKKEVEEIQKLRQELMEEKENHRIHAAQIEAAVMEQAHQSESWRVAYEAVTNSKIWRMRNRIRRLFGRKYSIRN